MTSDHKYHHFLPLSFSATISGTQAFDFVLNQSNEQRSIITWNPSLKKIFRSFNGMYNFVEKSNVCDYLD